jgi:hypothetical protein
MITIIICRRVSLVGKEEKCIGYKLVTLKGWDPLEYIGITGSMILRCEIME